MREESRVVLSKKFKQKVSDRTETVAKSNGQQQKTTGQQQKSACGNALLTRFVDAIERL